MRIPLSKHRERFPPRKVAHAPRVPRSEALTPAIASTPHSEGLAPATAMPATPAAPRSEGLILAKTTAKPGATNHRDCFPPRKLVHAPQIPHTEGLTPLLTTPLLTTATPRTEGLTPTTAVILVGSRTR
jgi:hypothetical protein